MIGCCACSVFIHSRGHMMCSEETWSHRKACGFCSSAANGLNLRRATWGTSARLRVYSAAAASTWFRFWCSFSLRMAFQAWHCKSCSHHSNPQLQVLVGPSWSRPLCAPKPAKSQESWKLLKPNKKLLAPTICLLPSWFQTPKTLLQLLVHFPSFLTLVPMHFGHEPFPLPVRNWLAPSGLLESEAETAKTWEVHVLTWQIWEWLPRTHARRLLANSFAISSAGVCWQRTMQDEISCIFMVPAIVLCLC